MKLFIGVLICTCTGTILSAFTSTRNPEANSNSESTHATPTELRNTNNAMVETTTKERNAGNVYLATTSSSDEIPHQFTLNSYLSGNKNTGNRIGRNPTVIRVTDKQLRNLENNRKSAKERTKSFRNTSGRDILYSEYRRKTFTNESTITATERRVTPQNTTILFGRPRLPPKRWNTISSHLLNVGQHPVRTILTPNISLRTEGNITASQRPYKMVNYKNVLNPVYNTEETMVGNLRESRRIKRADGIFTEEELAMGTKQIAKNNGNRRREFKTSKVYEITDEELAKLESQQGPKAIILSGKLTNIDTNNKDYDKKSFLSNPASPNNKHKWISKTVKTSYIVNAEPQNVHYLSNNAGKHRASPIKFNLHADIADKGNRGGRLDSSVSSNPQSPRNPPFHSKVIRRPELVPKWLSTTAADKTYTAGKDTDASKYSKTDQFSKKKQEILSWLQSLPIPEEGIHRPPFYVLVNRRLPFTNAYPDPHLINVQNGYTSANHRYVPTVSHHRWREGVGLKSNTYNPPKTGAGQVWYPYYSTGSLSTNRNINKWPSVHPSSQRNWPMGLYKWFS